MGNFTFVLYKHKWYTYQVYNMEYMQDSNKDYNMHKVSNKKQRGKYVRCDASFWPKGEKKIKIKRRALTK